MDTYEALANSVQINKNNILLSYDDSLIHVGTGRSAFVFRIKSTMKAMKVFFPGLSDIAIEEAEIYGKLQDTAYYPTIYATGENFIVMDYIEGLTLFECIVEGKEITPVHLAEIDHALALATAKGLNPSDIHLRNIFITTVGDIKIIDVARFRQEKDCCQWENLKKAYRQVYRKRYFPKKIPATLLNGIASVYKRGWIPTYRA